MNLYKFLDRAFGSLQYRSFVVWFYLQNLGKPRIPYLETHLCDHCNLNCKSCSHFCPLVTEPTFTDLEQYTKDIRVLSKKLAIRTIRLMGGEPLLHPQDIASKLIHTNRLYALTCAEIHAKYVTVL